MAQELNRRRTASRHLVIGLGAFLNATVDTVVQARRALAPSARGGRAQGIAFYSHAVTNKDGVPSADFFRALTGAGQEGAQPLFATSVKPPLMAWKVRPSKGYLKGFVRHPDGRPADGLTVEISGPLWRVMTVAGTGFYGTAELPPGRYAVTMTCFGQPVAAAETDVRAGTVATVDLEP